MTAGLRLLLAAATVLITRLDPSEPTRFAAATYTILLGYFIYALLLYVTLLRAHVLPGALAYLIHWVDVAVYVTLIGLSGGSNSIYFTLLFFAVLVASFRWGFAAGMEVTAASLVLFVLVALLTSRSDDVFDLNRFLFRSSSLPVLGYLIAYRGGFELRLRARLALLGELSAASNPRLGKNHVLASALERLRQAFKADTCIAITAVRNRDGFEMHRGERPASGGTPRAEPLPQPLAAKLLSFGDDALFFRSASAWRAEHVVARSSDGAHGATGAVDRNTCRDIVEMLDATAFITVPLRAGTNTSGRLFLAARSPAFDHRDCDFMLQAADQLMPLLDYVDLVDRMARRAAEAERQRIALDIHDRVIQSYIGVELGIAALQRLIGDRVADDSLPAVLSDSVGKLRTMTSQGIDELRTYVHELESPNKGSGLSESLHRFAELFRDATGIVVNLEIVDDARIEGQLAAEVFSMATEAVSNVRRHTNANRADVSVRIEGECLLLRVENPADPNTPPPPFTPRSITQRAAALHGTVAVERTADGLTAVIVQLPL